VFAAGVSETANFLQIPSQFFTPQFMGRLRDIANLGPDEPIKTDDTAEVTHDTLSTSTRRAP
jgi:hypothetical protein